MSSEANGTLFQDTLEMLTRCTHRMHDELPWLEQRAREEMANQCTMFLLEYHNPPKD